MRLRAGAAFLAIAPSIFAACGSGASVGGGPLVTVSAAASPASGASSTPGPGASGASGASGATPTPSGSATAKPATTPTASAGPPATPAPLPTPTPATLPASQVEITGSSPFANASCANASGTPALDSAAEPQAAVDPRDPMNVVLVWQQDRFNADGGALSNVVAVSHDGGRTFHQVLVNGLSLCTNGADQRVSDPWLSWGPDGTLYLASLTFSEAPQNAAIAGATALVAQRSTDAGETWSAPVAVQPNDNLYNDRESVTADPTRPGHAYYAFVLRYGSQGESGTEEFSSTADGGKTWTMPAPIYVPPPSMLTDPTLVNVLPDGSLLNTLIVANLTPFLPSAVPRVSWQIVAQRSTDAGATFSGAVTVATIYPAAPVDPQSGKVVRAYPVISTAIAPNGTAYLAWNEIPTATGPSAIRFSKSTDGGKTWSAPGLVKMSPSQAFLPSIAVLADGTIGVTYDDTRNDVSTGTADDFATDVWLSTSRDGGTSWTESHVAGPFNMATAPESDSAGVSGLFVGDYQGLIALPGRFGAVYAQGRPQATHGPTDLFFSRL